MRTLARARACSTIKKRAAIGRERLDRKELVAQHETVAKWCLTLGSLEANHLNELAR